MVGDGTGDHRLAHAGAAAGDEQAGPFQAQRSSKHADMITRPLPSDFFRPQPEKIGKGRKARLEFNVTLLL